MNRHIAKIVCLIIAAAAGWAVLTGLADVFQGWIPPVGGVMVMGIVFILLYFPLARHVADVITDRLSVAVHRGRHIRAGSGIDFIPETKKLVTCSICGAPDGPICRQCDEQMQRSSRVSLKP